MVNILVYILGVHNNAGLVLKLQLIVQNLSFIFSTNDAYAELVCLVYLWKFLRLTYMILCVKEFNVTCKILNESLRVLKPHSCLCLMCVNNVACVPKSFELNCFSSFFFFLFLIIIMCIKMLHMFQRVESTHETGKVFFETPKHLYIQDIFMTIKIYFSLSIQFFTWDSVHPFLSNGWGSNFKK